MSTLSLAAARSSRSIEMWVLGLGYKLEVDHTSPVGKSITDKDAVGTAKK